MCRYLALTCLAICLANSAQAQQYAFFRVEGPPLTAGGPRVQSTGALTQPALSADGRTLVLRADAGNLFPGVSGAQVLAYTPNTGALALVSVAPNGQPSASTSINDRPAVSANGRYVAFETTSSTYTGGIAGVHIVRVDRQNNQFEIVNLNTGGTVPSGTSSRMGGISADGRFVVFTSNAASLVAGDGGNSSSSVFVRDLASDTTQRMDIAASGAAGNGASFGERPAISADGRWVVFASTASNLVGGGPFSGSQRIYLRDRQNATTTRVSIGPGGSDLSGAGSASISADGASVAFTSNSIAGGTGLWARRLSSANATAVPAAANMGLCDIAGIADSGFVITQCRNSNANLPSQAYAWSLQSAATPPELISGSDPGNTIPGNATSGRTVTVNADTRIFAFDSLASDLIDSDTNGSSDIFIYAELGFIDTLFADGFE